MREFFRSFFASALALALFAGLGFLLLLATVALMTPTPPAVPSKAVLVLDLGLPIPDSTQDSGGTLVDLMESGTRNGPPLLQVLEALEQATKDSRIAGLYLTGHLPTGGGASGPATLKELREALARFKASGKPVIAYNPTWNKWDLYVGSVASVLASNPMGELDLTGLAAEPTFFGGLFAKYGIEVQVARVGQFKGAVEPFTSDRLSEPNRIQIQKYLDDVWSQWKATIAKDRKVTPETLQLLADEVGMVPTARAKELGLLDRLAHQDEILEDLRKLTGSGPKDRTFTQIDLETYVKAAPLVRAGTRIAVVYAEGDIVDGEGSSQQAGGARLSRELRALRQNPEVKAIVLRVNSPGGSALASELIHREVVITRKVKPVVVSMGSTAASGGYWILTHGDRIFAEPHTLTGSIGVFSLLPNVRKLAKDHGITWDQVQTSRLANPTTLARPKDAQEMARFQALTDATYDAFLERVAEGRKLSKEAVHTLAQGRIWSGQEALHLGLVDELGGLMDAVRHAATLAKAGTNFRIDPVAPPRSPLEKLLHLLQDDGKPIIARTPQEGQAQTRLRHTLQFLKNLDDSRGIHARLAFDLTPH